MVEQVPARALTINQQHERGDASRAARRVGVEGMHHRKERQRDLLSLRYQKTSDNGHLPMLESSSSHYFMYICVLPARMQVHSTSAGARGCQQRVVDSLASHLLPLPP